MDANTPPPGRFFLVKSSSIDSLVRAIDAGVWALPLRKNPPQPLDDFNLAFTQGPVYLVASVAKSKRYQAVGRMLEAIRAEGGTTIKGEDGEDILVSAPFKVHWTASYPALHTSPGLPFTKTAHLTCLYEGRPVLVNNARNCMEMPPAVGRELLHLFDEDLAAFLQQRLAAELAREQREEEKKKERTVLTIFEDWGEREKAWLGQEGEKEAVRFFLERLSSVGKVLLVSLYGSKRYNTFTTSSDLDLFAVVLFPSSMLTTFAPVEDTLKNPEGSQFDFTVHTFEYFCELLKRGDGKMLETLYQGEQSILFESPEWKQFRLEASQGGRFLTKAAVSNFLGEIRGNKGIKQLEKAPTPATVDETTRLFKKWYIVQRLLIETKEILERNTLRLWLPDESPERRFLLEVRAGQHSHESLLALFKEKMKEIDALFAASPLPSDASAQKGFLNAFIRQLHPELIDHSLPAFPPPVADLSSPLPLDPSTQMLLFLAKRRNDKGQDFFGVYLNPAFSILELDSSFTDTASSRGASESSGSTTFSLFEAGKFCVELLRGNVVVHLESVFHSPEAILYIHPLLQDLLRDPMRFHTAKLMSKAINWMKSFSQKLGTAQGRMQFLVELPRCHQVAALLSACTARLDEQAETVECFLQVASRLEKIQAVDETLAAISELLALTAAHLEAYLFLNKPLRGQGNLKSLLLEWIGRARELN